MNKQVNLAGANWKKSTFSNPDNCVEIAKVAGHYAMRDSKNPAGPALVFTPGEFDAFKKGVAAGEFD